MLKIDFLDNTNLQVIIFRKLYKIAQDKWLTATQWAEKSNIQQADLSKVMNWKKWIIDEKMQRLLDTIWVSQRQLDEIVKEAKKDELKIYYWEDIDVIPHGKVNTLEDIDFDNEELLKVMFKKDWLKEPTEDDIKEIMNFIKFKAKK